MALNFEDNKCADEVLSLYMNVKASRGEYFLIAKNMKDQYNGDIALPLPQVDKMEKPAVANLIAQGIDQASMSVASVRPAIDFSPLSTTDIAIKRSDQRRKAVNGWWDMNRWQLQIRRRARHLTAYGMTVVSILPCSDDMKDHRGIPFWRVENPLNTFPAPMNNPDSMEPDWCIFTEKHSMDWFMKMYPGKAGSMFAGRPNPTDRYEILRYVDENETVLVGIGAEKHDYDRFGHQMGVGIGQVTLLDRIPNRVGLVPVVIAGRITLDRLQGQFDQTLGAYHRLATLDALNTIAIFRNVFADEWAVSSSNSPSSPRIIKRANGKTGEIGIIDKGQLQSIRPPMNQEAQIAMSNYERSVRLSGVPAAYGGESPSNVRTGRQLAGLLGDQVDMQLQESQELLAASAEIEITLAINTALAYYPDQKTAFYFSKTAKNPPNDYVPVEIFDTDVARVAYPMPGSDIAGMTVQMIQMHGAGELSLESMRHMDPRIKDPTVEAELVEIEALEKSLLTGVEQGAAQGTMLPVAVAKIIKARKKGTSLVDAMIAVDEEQQKQQAQAMNQQQDPNQPGAVPALQPGATAGPPVPGTQPQPTGKPSLSDLLAGLGGAAPEQNAVAQAPAPAPAGV